MEEKFTSKTSYRISGKSVHVGRVSDPSIHPGQNDGFSDGFLTKIRVVTCRSGQPGKSNDPVKPMKSIDYTPSVGFPPDPPSGSLGNATPSMVYDLFAVAA
jgi:hypothetical protein